MTNLAVLLSRLFALLLDISPLRDWAKTKSNSQFANWIKSLAAIFNIDRLVSLDLAWWPFRAMKFIECHFTGKQICVFEWGSGASTIWMLKRGYKVTSVEHDERWAQKVKMKSQELRIPFESIIKVPITASVPRIGSKKKGFENLDFSDYVAAINNYELFDLIVIDGRVRVDCLSAARAHLKDDGIILFDNSNRKRYRDEIESEWLENKIKGMTPASPLSTQSSILRLI